MAKSFLRRAKNESQLATFDVVADVAQLVRAPVCGTGGRGFNPHHSPHIKSRPLWSAFYMGNTGLNLRLRSRVRNAGGISQGNLLLQTCLQR